MRKTILVVDDSMTVRRQIALTLGQAGYDIVEAESGQHAIDVLSATPGLAMAIADVNMPMMDGIKMLRKLREANITPKLPVLMLTTEGQPELIEAARSHGARGWMIKPYRSDALVSAVKRLAGEP
jgi:two-component system chemotaxis response regulator CheY